MTPRIQASRKVLHCRMSEIAPALSVIVPLYNEEDSVEPLYRAVVAALEQYPRGFELLLVDDGSRDTTYWRAATLASKDRRVKVIKFRRNFGQTPAMAAGIDHASGDILVTMDGDLQNDPADILRLVEAVEAGSDLAVGWRFNRQDKLVTRKIPSRIANWLIGKVTGVPIKDNGCSLKAYRAEVIKRVPLYSEMHRFIPAMSSITGARIAQIKVRHHARRFGASKYGLSRIYKVLFDLLAIKTIVGFAPRPLRWFGLISLPFLLLAPALGLLSLWLMLNSPQTPVVVFTGLSILAASAGGFLLICGALGELIFRTGNLRPSDFTRLTARHDH